MNTPTSSSRQCGGTAAGFLAGVVVGLAVAAGTAVLVTRAPVPFVNKDLSAHLRSKATEDGRLPDPNKGLVRSSGVADPATAKVAPVRAGAAPIRSAQPTGNAIYLLQAGAFRRLSDAESMRARLALIGFEGQIQQALLNNETLYRVRVGPYLALEGMNTARADLANNGIEVSVVRQ